MLYVTEKIITLKREREKLLKINKAFSASQEQLSSLSYFRFTSRAFSLMKIIQLI